MQLKFRWTLLIHLSIVVNSLYLGINPAKAEIAEIKNPAWKEVPGTKPVNPREGYEDPWYVDVNGITKSGNIITFDAVGSDVSYARIQIDCKTNLGRAIRQGYFKSETQVDFDVVKNNWWSYGSEISQFVCNL